MVPTLRHFQVGGHDALLGHRESGMYGLPPFPAPLGMRTIALWEARLLLQASWGQGLTYQLLPYWLWHIHGIQRVRHMQNTEPTVNPPSWAFSCHGTLVAAKFASGWFVWVMRPDCGQDTISKLDGYLSNRPLLSHSWFHYLLSCHRHQQIKGYSCLDHSLRGSVKSMNTTLSSALITS